MTGMLLGILGSGGSIITLPALIYLLGMGTKTAIAMSLGIVGVTASIAAVQHWRKGNVNLSVALVFGLFGAVGTFAGAKIGIRMPDLLQLGLFAVIMYLAAYRMLRPKRIAPDQGGSSESDAGSGQRAVSAHLGHIAVHGIFVGILAGIVGVGGGFLIVPALVLLSNLTIKRAVGTSLAVVAAQAFSGFAGYIGSVSIDYGVMGTFTAVAVVSSIVGGAISHRLSAVMLKKSFGVFLVIVATYIVIKEFAIL